MSAIFIYNVGYSPIGKIIACSGRTIMSHKISEEFCMKFFKAKGRLGRYIYKKRFNKPYKFKMISCGTINDNGVKSFIIRFLTYT